MQKRSSIRRRRTFGAPGAGIEKGATVAPVPGLSLGVGAQQTGTVTAVARDAAQVRWGGILSRRERWYHTFELRRVL